MADGYAARWGGNTKPIWLVDMDGPLADFDGHFWDLCRGAGVEMDCEEHEQTERYATGHVVDSMERRVLRRHINTDPRWFADLPVVPGAIEGINLLAEHADVWICTKPLEANRYCRDGKAEWVRKHLGKDWEKRLLIASDKSLVYADMLLDDAPFLEWLPRATWKPVVFTAPFNGAGSEWEHLQHWTWGDPIEVL